MYILRCVWLCICLKLILNVHCSYKFSRLHFLFLQVKYIFFFINFLCCLLIQRNFNALFEKLRPLRTSFTGYSNCNEMKTRAINKQLLSDKVPPNREKLNNKMFSQLVVSRRTKLSISKSKRHDEWRRINGKFLLLWIKLISFCFIFLGFYSG